MAQVINTNSLSLLTQNNLNKSQSALGTAIERLSSGLRINSDRLFVLMTCAMIFSLSITT